MITGNVMSSNAFVHSTLLVDISSRTVASHSPALDPCCLYLDSRFGRDCSPDRDCVTFCNFQPPLLNPPLETRAPMAVWLAAAAAACQHGRPWQVTGTGLVSHRKSLPPGNSFRSYSSLSFHPVTYDRAQSVSCRWWKKVLQQCTVWEKIFFLNIK